MLNYLFNCLSSIEARFPGCGILLLGDFNKLCTSRLCNSFGLKQIVKFPTRGQNTLDLVLTNLKEFYNPPVKRPPFGLPDHDSIEVQPLERAKQDPVQFVVNSRDLRPSNRFAFRKYLEEVDNLRV